MWSCPITSLHFTLTSPTKTHSTSPHLTSPHLTSHHLTHPHSLHLSPPAPVSPAAPQSTQPVSPTSPHPTSPTHTHSTSPHLTSLHFTSPHLTHPHSLHLTPPHLTPPSLQDVVHVVEQLQNEKALLAILRRLSQFGTKETPPPAAGDGMDQQLLDQDYIDHPVGLVQAQPLVVEEESSNEKQRVVFDQLADEQQCRMVMQLARVSPIPNWSWIPNGSHFNCYSRAEWHRGGWVLVQDTSHQTREV